MINLKISEEKKATTPLFIMRTFYFYIFSQNSTLDNMHAANNPQHHEKKQQRFCALKRKREKEREWRRNYNTSPSARDCSRCFTRVLVSDSSSSDPRLVRPCVATRHNSQAFHTSSQESAMMLRGSGLARGFLAECRHRAAAVSVANCSCAVNDVRPYSTASWSTGAGKVCETLKKGLLFLLASLPARRLSMFMLLVVAFLAPDPSPHLLLHSSPHHLNSAPTRARPSVCIPPTTNAEPCENAPLLSSSFLVLLFVAPTKPPHKKKKKKTTHHNVPTRRR